MRDAGGPDAAIAWLVFAEDWGRHPSTAQHLIAHLPLTDRVVWVDSIGMRAPRLRWGDLRRAVGKVVGTVAGPRSGTGTGTGRGTGTGSGTGSGAGTGTGTGTGTGRRPDRVLRPLVSPWHLDPGSGWLNRRILRAVLKDVAPSVVLSANPVVVRYVEVLPLRRLVYLRADDYARLPGVDADLVRATEPAMMARADLIVAPNAGLAGATGRVLPQGVDVEAFRAVPLEVPASRVLGYWGAIAPWLDIALIIAVARARPDWTLELRGAMRLDRRDEARLREPGNIRILPAVAHSELAHSAAHWRAAWAPFRGDLQIQHASPLKLREYLAAGFPSASTPLPELAALPDITVVGGAGDVVRWLDDLIGADDAAARRARRERMREQGWAGRAATLRAWIEEGLS